MNTTTDAETVMDAALDLQAEVNRLRLDNHRMREAMREVSEWFDGEPEPGCITRLNAALSQPGAINDR